MVTAKSRTRLAPAKGTPLGERRGKREIGGEKGKGKEREDGRRKREKSVYIYLYLYIYIGVSCPASRNPKR